MTSRIAVIGSGITGLTSARALADAGREVVVFDKGRGIGGRMATRRVGDDMAFDHGAQYFRARSEGFRALVAGAEASGAVARWAPASGEEPAWVGTPGMNGLAKHMAKGLDLRQGVEITAAKRSREGWELHHAGGIETAAHVVCTVPVVQARALFGHEPGVLDALAPVTAKPCWALMIALDAPVTAPDYTRPETGPLAWIARNSTKPGRPTVECWIAHATPEWSEAHLEEQKEAVAAALLDSLTELLGETPAARHVAAHRWRYATTRTPLGAPFLRADGLHIGGDWCLGARVEHGYESGASIAADLVQAAR